MHPQSSQPHRGGPTSEDALLTNAMFGERTQLFTEKYFLFCVDGRSVSAVRSLVVVRLPSTDHLSAPQEMSLHFSKCDVHSLHEQDTVLVQIKWTLEQELVSEKTLSK